MFLSVYLFVYLSHCHSICLFVCSIILPIYLSLFTFFLNVYLSIYLHLSIYLNIGGLLPIYNQTLLNPLGFFDSLIFSMVNILYNVYWTQGHLAKKRFERKIFKLDSGSPGEGFFPIGTIN